MGHCRGPGLSKVTLIDAASGKSVATYESQGTAIYALAWSPTGDYIATVEHGSSSNVIRVWIAHR